MLSVQSSPAVDVSELTHRYGSRIALDALTLRVESEEIFGLLGPNGGGKTTLFRILSTLCPPTKGSARIFGASITTDPQIVRKKIGVLFQNPSLDPRLTVQENLRHQGHLYGMSGLPLLNRINEMLERCGVRDRSKNLVETLSGGLRRRVEIAKGLLHSPKLLLLDEPSTGIDPGARREIWSTLRELRDRDHVTIFLTTHIMEEAEGCDRVAILHRGKLITVDTPESLKSSIRGDVISIESKNPQTLAEQIQTEFGMASTVFNGTVRVEHPEGHRFLPRLMESFPGEISAVAMRKPTLEDVFVHRTGDRFKTEEGFN